MRPPRSVRNTALGMCFAALLATGEAAAQPFPRVGLYGQMQGGGYPFVKPDLTLDTLEIGRVARFTEVAIDVFPISPYRPDVLQALRARNPSIRIIGYVLTGDIWQAADPDSTRHIPTIIRHTVRDLNGFLYDRNTGGEYPEFNINLAKRTNGRYVVAEALADIFRDHILATGVWDGIFTDVFCRTIAWTQGGTTKVIDYQRAGYASLAALDAAWIEASEVLASRLRQDAGPNFTLVGNCAMSSQHAWYNGWMRENFPFQQGGTWHSNMLGDAASRGYFADDRDYLPPPRNWILSISTFQPGTEYQASNTTKVRYGLASAALGEGVHAIGPGRDSRVAPYHQWWYDEYAVNLATGQSSASLSHTGWLGQPLGPRSTWLWPNPNPDVITNNSFETDVTSGWTFFTAAPAAATLARDATTGGVGTSSARISVTASSTIEWHVNFSSVGQILTQAGATYSATFWCKANPPRRIRVVAGSSGGNAYVDVDQTWRQVQAVMPVSASVQTTLSFFLGLQTGDVWLDDVHFQRGSSSVWRRDFQNGIVLVNPTENSLNVPLETSFRRILGTRTPGINTGAVSSNMMLGAYDALFLLRGSLDSVPPAPTENLRIRP